MNINDKIKVNNSTEIELLEDAKKGDIIDLATLNKVDVSFLQNLINKEKEIEFRSMLEKELKAQNEKHTLEIQKIKLECESENNEDKQKLIDKINQLNSEIEKMNSIKDSDLRLAKEQIKNSYENKISTLENDKKLIESKYEVEKMKEIDKVKQIKDEEISNLKLELSKVDIKVSEAVQNKEKEMNAKIKELEAQNNSLTFAKSMVGIKDLGENLEQWCDNQYQEHAIYGFENCEWIKDNIAVEDELDSKKTKGDFIFKVYADSSKKENTLLTSVLLDMKDKNPNSTSKNKNSEHYKKLDTDRRKKKCDYAILVSNLERDRAVNDAPVFRVSEYDKMYVVRPEYFMTFLSLLASLSVKYASYITTERKDLINKEEAIKMFEDFKEEILVKSFSSLNKSIEDMLKKAQTIQSSANDIIDECRKIQDKTLEKLKKKITDFKILKAVESLE